MVGLVAAVELGISHTGYKLVTEYLMKTVLSNLTHRAKVSTLTGVLSFCLFTGCAQQQSAPEIDNSSSDFYGAINGSGELFTQQSVPSKVFAAQLNCS